MAAALKLAPKQDSSIPPAKSVVRETGQNSILASKKNKQDGWEMTASEALRVNFVDKEIKFDKRVVDYISEY